MKPLVIGATGFIGYNITKILNDKGFDVRCSRRESSNTLFLRKLKPELATASLDDFDSLCRAMVGRDTVFLAATHYPRYSVNMADQVALAEKQTANAVQAALKAGVERFIFTSSAATAEWKGNKEKLITEDHIATTPPPASVYHAIKIAAEKVVADATAKGLASVILCPTGCIGEFDAKAGTGFIIPALARGLLKFYADGKINLVDVSEVARAHVAAAERPEAMGKRYLLGGHNLTVGELIGKICSRFDLAEPKLKIPLKLAALITSFDEKRCLNSNNGRRPAMAREFIDILRFGRFVSSEKAIKELDLGVPPLEETLDRAWNWFARHGYLGSKYKRNNSKNQTIGENG